MRLQVMRCGSQVMRCGFVSHEMRVAIAKCRGIGEVSSIRLWRTFVTPLS